MAIADKKKKKFQGGPKRKSYLKSMASKTSRPMGQYMKYGDIDPNEVHEGDATYRDVTVSDAPGASLTGYSVNVKRGHSKDYFRFQGKLYHVTNFAGTGYEEVQV